jgi:hypothetical protein
MPPGWSRGAGSGPRPSAAFAFTPRRRSRPHRIPVEPDLEREGVRAETGGFLGRFAKVLPRQGTHVAGRPDLLVRIQGHAAEMPLHLFAAGGRWNGRDRFCGR